MTNPSAEEIREIHNKLITKIDGHFFGNKFKQFKQMFQDDFLPRDLASAEDVMDIVNLLQRDQKIAPGDYKYLKKRITHLNKAFVENVIVNAEKEIQSIRAKVSVTSIPRSSSPKGNPEENMYEINTKQQGLVIILDIMPESRPGSKQDASNLTTFFETTLGFEVYNFEKLSKQQIHKHLNDASALLKKEHGNKYYCFVCVVMSHGGLSGITTHDTPEVFIKIDEITDHFNNCNLRAFIGKPKIFIVQCCRGDDTTPSVAKDSLPVIYIDSVTVPKDADILIAHATTDSFISVRIEEQGTWFLNTLVSVLEKCYKSQHLEEMLISVRQKVAQLRVRYPDRPEKEPDCQMPCCWTTLTKSLYLRSAKN